MEKMFKIVLWAKTYMVYKLISSFISFSFIVSIIKEVLGYQCGPQFSSSLPCITNISNMCVQHNMFY